MNPLLAILNIFIDPAEAVRNMESRFAWVLPMLLSSVVGIGATFVTMPIILQVMRTNPPANIPAEQMEKVLESTAMMSKASLVTTPLIMAIITALSALVLFAACSVLDVKTSFKRLFTFCAHAGLIMSIAQIAGTIVLKMKGEISSMKELQPSFGGHVVGIDVMQIGIVGKGDGAHCPDSGAFVCSKTRGILRFL